MAKKAKYRGHELPAQALRERRELARSGAAGVHTDQNARRHRTAGLTNRIGSRTARVQAAIRDQTR